MKYPFFSLFLAFFLPIFSQFWCFYTRTLIVFYCKKWVLTKIKQPRGPWLLFFLCKRWLKFGILGWENVHSECEHVNLGSTPLPHVFPPICYGKALRAGATLGTRTLSTILSLCHLPLGWENRIPKWLAYFHLVLGTRFLATLWLAFATS